MEKRIWHDFYDQGVPVDIAEPERHLPDMLESTAFSYPKHTAIDFFGAKTNYERLFEQVQKMSVSLARLGVKRGDRVAVMLPNCPQAVIAYYAILGIGAVAVMTNPMYVEDEIIHQMNDAGAKVMFGLDHLFPRIKKVWGQTPLKHLIMTSIRDYLPFPLNLLYPLKARMQKLNMDVPYDDRIHSFKKLLNHERTLFPRGYFGMDDLAVLQYTGGTTGLAKGAMLTHRNLAVNVAQLAAWNPTLEAGRERVLCVIPLFHVFGMTAGMNLSIKLAATMVLLPRFELKQFLKTLVKAKPTLALLVPTIMTAMVNHPGISGYDLSSIEYTFSGSAPLPVEIMDKYEKLTGGTVFEGYGLTEASPATHVNPIAGQRKPGSIGIALPGTDARIVDIEHGTKQLPADYSGELVIKGPQVMGGYLNRPDETSETLRDGWLYTGDIAHMDEEGYVFIDDRKKDMILAGGFNVYPREIDEVLYRHPKVAEAAAIGVPDEYRGETVKVFIVVKPGESLSADEVIAYCREKLAAYKVPRLVEFRDDLPKTIIGKVLRKVLRTEELNKREIGNE